MVKQGTLRLAQVVGKYIIGVFIFILIGSLPVLLRDLEFDVNGYITSIKELAVKIFTLSSLTYDGEHEMLPAIMDRYFYSLKTLSLSFIFAVILAFILSYIIVLFLKNKKDYVLSFIEIVRTVPDIVGIFLLQSLFIWINKAYGVKLVQTVSLGSENQAFLLPLLSLSMPIFLFLTQVIVLKIFEELDKQYIAFAKAKGLSFLYLLNIHVIRNIRHDLLGHLKTIIWMMLSTLVIVEYIFNMDGLMMFNIKHVSIELFVFSCILLFTPFFILYRFIDLRR
ncbi:ABC transporter permease subunit [Heyndrickxia sp. MSNUG]|uniref:ABC transporter permease subunit n=1 Tax=Heyndrickxia sp. MSNUG TaxID=3136677 RepID=UPI003C2CBC62